MDQIQSKIEEQLHKLTSVVPPHILAPIIIGILTILSVAVLVQKAADEDIYEPREKHVIKVEEVRSIHVPLYWPLLM